MDNEHVHKEGSPFKGDFEIGMIYPVFTFARLNLDQRETTTTLQQHSCPGLGFDAHLVHVNAACTGAMT